MKEVNFQLLWGNLFGGKYKWNGILVWHPLVVGSYTNHLTSLSLNISICENDVLKELNVIMCVKVSNSVQYKADFKKVSSFSLF